MFLFHVLLLFWLISCLWIVNKFNYNKPISTAALKICAMLNYFIVHNTILMLVLGSSSMSGMSSSASSLSSSATSMPTSDTSEFSIKHQSKWDFWPSLCSPEALDNDGGEGWFSCPKKFFHVPLSCLARYVQPGEQCAVTFVWRNSFKHFFFLLKKVNLDGFFCNFLFRHI